jgi:hypothetical protein
MVLEIPRRRFYKLVSLKHLPLARSEILERGAG